MQQYLETASDTSCYSLNEKLFVLREKRTEMLTIEQISWKNVLLLRKNRLTNGTFWNRTAHVGSSENIDNFRKMRSDKQLVELGTYAEMWEWTYFFVVLCGQILCWEEQ